MLEEKNEEIINYLKEINNKIDSLDRRVGIQEERFNKLEGTKSIQAEQAAPNIQIVKPAPPLPNVPQLSEKEKAYLESLEKSKNKAENTNDLEQNIGGKWFARIGILALILGISFFLKYAFDNNWIGPVGRIIIGIVTGLTLLALGEKTIRKYFAYGQIISGGGIAVLYLSVFAAFNFYHLIPQIPAFLFMALITAVGIAVSLRYNAISLIIISILGGFLTPYLVSNGQNNQIGLFSYIALLDLAILFVSFFKKWRVLNIIGFVGTAAIFGGWTVEFYSSKQLFSTFFFLSLFFAIYSISSLIYNLAKKEKSSGVEQILTLFSAVAYFASSYALLNHDYHIFMGFFALIMAIYYFLWAYLVREITRDDENLYTFLAFLTVGFITLAIPIQFNGNIITIGWIIEACILILAGIKIKQEGIFILGIAVFTLSVVRLLIVDSAIGHENVFVIFNKEFLTYLFAVVASYAVFFAAKKIGGDFEEEDVKKKYSPQKIAAIFLIVANFFTIFSISREIVVFYKNQINISQKKIDALRDNYTRKNSVNYPERSNYLQYNNSNEYKVLKDDINKINNRESITLSLFWLAYGIMLVLIGILIKSRAIRIGGMILLILAMLKLFFYDLWNLGTLYRIISSMSLGVILLLISFIYQKYRNKIKEII